MEQYLAMTGQEPATLTEGLKERRDHAVKVDLALRSVADAEGIEVTDDDLEAEYQRIAVRVNQKVNQVRKAYERNDAVSGLRGEIRKAKALEWLLRHVEIVDTEGDPIDRELLLPPDESSCAGRGRPRRTPRPRPRPRPRRSRPRSRPRPRPRPPPDQRSGDP